MPRYRYTAYDPLGKPVSGEVDGGNAASAIQALRKEGLVPVEVRPQAAKEPSRARTGKAVSLEDHLLFCRSLASYLRGGLTLSHVLVLLAKQSPSTALRALYTRLKAEVEGGRSLGTAMRESGQFREDLVGMVESGERSARNRTECIGTQAQMGYFAQIFHGMPFFLQRIFFRVGCAVHFNFGSLQLHTLTAAHRFSQNAIYTKTGSRSDSAH